MNIHALYLKQKDGSIWISKHLQVRGMYQKDVTAQSKLLELKRNPSKEKK